MTRTEWEEQKAELERRIKDIVPGSPEEAAVRQQYEELLAQEAELESDAASSLPLVFHNLPQPDYGKFIGREQELAKVTRVLRPYPHSQHSVVTIDGIGGIGKSALALKEETS